MRVLVNSLCQDLTHYFYHCGRENWRVLSILTVYSTGYTFTKFMTLYDPSTLSNDTNKNTNYYQERLFDEISRQNFGVI